MKIDLKGFILVYLHFFFFRPIETMRHISGAKTKVKDSKIRRHNTLANLVAENSIVESLL